MKGLRKIAYVLWTAKKTNQLVLNKAGVKRELLDTVKARKLAYCNSTSSSNFNLHLPSVCSERDGRSCQLLMTSSKHLLSCISPSWQPHPVNPRTNPSIPESVLGPRRSDLHLACQPKYFGMDSPASPEACDLTPAKGIQARQF